MHICSTCIHFNGTGILKIEKYMFFPPARSAVNHSRCFSLSWRVISYVEMSLHIIEVDVTRLVVLKGPKKHFRNLTESHTLNKPLRGVNYRWNLMWCVVPFSETSTKAGYERQSHVCSLICRRKLSAQPDLPWRRPAGSDVFWSPGPLAPTAATSLSLSNTHKYINTGTHYWEITQNYNLLTCAPTCACTCARIVTRALRPFVFFTLIRHKVKAFIGPWHLCVYFARKERMM